MTKQKIFGTDGVRGTANVEPVTAETAMKLGRAAAHVFKNLSPQSRGRGKHKIVIGKDTRLSGYMLENAISAGVLSMGVDVLFIGPLPTPGVAYNTRSLRADAGIVITASHNPYDDNGIKFFRADGYKLDDKIEDEIEHLVFSGEIENIRATASAIGKAVRIDDALGRYIEYAKASFPRRMTLEGMRVVVDCGHGAAYKATPCVLRELGAELIVYNDKPDGTNINRDCGSMHPEGMCAKVREHQADIGVAHDGDADRVLLCDETGTLIDGDDIMVIACQEMLANGTLANNTLVSTVMSNAGVDAAITKAGGRVIRTAVGDKNVIDEMLRSGFNFGGEQSGHLIFRDFSSTGDGLVAALQILRIMKSQNAKLSELKKNWTRYPQLVTNVQQVRSPAGAGGDDYVLLQRTDDVVFAVAIYDREGSLVFGVSTEHLGIPFVAEPGTGVVEFEYPSVALMDGTFEIRCGIQSTGSVVYDWREKAAVLEVMNPGRALGALYLDVKAEIKPDRPVAPA